MRYQTVFTSDEVNDQASNPENVKYETTLAGNNFRVVAYCGLFIPQEDMHFADDAYYCNFSEDGEHTDCYESLYVATRKVQREAEKLAGTYSLPQIDIDRDI